MAQILLVDDEIEFRDLLKNILTLEMHSVVCAGDGNEALKLFSQQTFDVVITDLVMPDKEGFEVIMEIRKLSPSIKIIAMTGGGFASASSYLSIAQAFGVNKTLAKPFSRDELLHAIAITLAEA